MKDKAIFRTIYGILLAAIILFADFAVDYVQANINEYEDSQPYHVVEAAMDDFIEAVKNGNADELIVYPDIEISPYENDIFAEYKKKIANVSEWTWKILSGSYSETEQIYGFYGDGELLAKLQLKCDDSKIIMEILTSNRWSNGKISPVVTLTKYTQCIDIPSNFMAKLDGRDVTKTSDGVTWEERNGNVVYTIDNLYNLKDVRVFDQYGNECGTVSENGYVTAKYNNYNLILPTSFIVSDKGKLLKGYPENGSVHYEYATLSDSLLIEDDYGHKMEYRNGDDVTVSDVAFKIPDCFTVKWGDRDMQEFVVSREANEAYAEFEKFAEMPRLVSYRITGLLKLPELELTDNFNRRIDYEFEHNYFEISDLYPMDTVPKEVIEAVDPVSIVKNYSLFLTNDLEGDQHGFGALKEYLIEGTDLYENSYKYATGKDITWMDQHDYTEFIEEKLSNYIMYDEKMFSCDVYLKKEIYIRTKYETGEIYDETNSTFFFCLHDGKWKLAGLRAKMEN